MCSKFLFVLFCFVSFRFVEYCNHLRRCYTVQEFWCNLSRNAISTNFRNVSCNLSYFDDHMKLKKHFHWLVRQTVAKQVAGQMLHCTMSKKFVATVGESRTQFYFPRRFPHLVSRRFGLCKVCYIGQRLMQLVSQRRCDTSYTKNCTV